APVRQVAAAAPSAAAALPLEGVVFPIAATAGSAFDASLVAPAILIVAGALALWRLGLLAVGAGRLSRLLGRLDDVDAATARMVGDEARRLGVPTPRTGVSRTATEPLLTGFRRARLILPSGLAAGDPEVA